MFGIRLQTMRTVFRVGGGARTDIIAIGDDVSCGTVSAAGWEKKLPERTQIILIRRTGAGVGAFPIRDPAPPDGAEVVFLLSSTGVPNPIQQPNAGTLLVCDAAVSAVRGKLSAIAGPDRVDGLFIATSCPTGTLPEY